MTNSIPLIYEYFLIRVKLRHDVIFIKSLSCENTLKRLIVIIFPLFICFEGIFFPLFINTL